MSERLTSSLTQNGKQPVVLSNRNVIINGAMQVAQRGTSTASIVNTGYYTADRWIVALGTLGTWTQSVEADAPTGSGFRNSVKMLCTTADASPAAGDLNLFRQSFEGQNLQQFLKGTASAKRFALSFWVKSNLTGTYIIELEDSTNSRSVSASYTVSASATWEKKTVIFPADTTGAFANSNAAALNLSFWNGAGSTYTSGTLQTTWGTVTSANRAVGGVNLAATLNNYWQVTGVQLEVGSVATPFEFEDIGTTLAKCQRYFCKTFNYSVAPATAAGQLGAIFAARAYGAFVQTYMLTWYFPVGMRAEPTVTTFSPNAAADSNWYDEAGASIAAATGNISTTGVLVYNSAASVANRNGTIHISASAEL